MAARSASPRIPPLPESEWDEDVRSLLDGAAGPARDQRGGQREGGRAINIFSTLVRHRGLYRRWLPFAGKLLTRGRLQPRDRELLILRTAWHCRAEYEWGQHVLIARRVGISDEEIHRVREGPSAPGWSADDAALLRAADELHNQAEISDRTWGELASHLDEAQLIELCMLVGNYHLVAYALNSLRVQREEGVPSLQEP